MQLQSDFEKFRIEKSPVIHTQLGHSGNIHCLLSLALPQSLVMLPLKSVGVLRFILQWKKDLSCKYVP